MSKFNVIIISLLIAGCAHQNSIAKGKYEWLFAHIAPQGNVVDGTTIVMPVTQDFIAFTMDPYTLHSKVNVNEFISLIDKSNLKKSLESLHHQISNATYYLNIKDVKIPNLEVYRRIEK